MAEEKLKSKSEPDLWHTISSDDALQRLDSSKDGLTEEKVRQNREKYGPNQLQEAEKTPAWSILLNQFKNILIIILIIAAVVSVFIGEAMDAAVILVIVCFCAVLGFTQEYRAEKSIEALKRMAAPKTLVMRAGETCEIPTEDVVPGDIIVLESGNRIPADSRLLNAIDLHVDEAPLTGESVPVGKDAKAILKAETPLAERENMLYTATSITYGKAKAVVATTGMNTEFGKIAKMIQAVEEPPTPLQVRLDQVGKWLSILCLSICVIVAITGILRGHELFEMFIVAVALAIAAVPEALPAVVTMGLAIGVRRMSKRNSIVRKLPAVETLGCTTVICSDKTGTLTRGEMNVRKIMADGKVFFVSGEGYEPRGEFSLEDATGHKMAVNPKEDDHVMALLRIGALCNDSQLKGGTVGNQSEGKKAAWHIEGDPTEGAILVAGMKAGIDPKDAGYPRVSECPFSSERRRMTTCHTIPDGSKVAYLKGAPETVLELCTQIYEGGNVRPLTDEDKKKILDTYQKMAGEEALRVLGMAYKVLPKDSEDYSAETVEKEMVFVGLEGMIDAAREEAKEAIDVCKRAGIKVVMITGDNKLTAQAVARELGLYSGDGGKALTGTELDQMSHEEFVREAKDVVVYARVDPEHKTRIVNALKEHGEVVAMTGDGVNDAPALKNADIGVSMGISGTDVTKEASDMILTDDNFASIVAAVEEGRGIYGNIKKYLIYLLSANIGEIGILFLAILFGWPLPLIAIQLLWVNLATDGLPAIALSIDPADPDVMQRSPRDPKESVFGGTKVTMAGISFLITVGLLFAFNLVVHDEGIAYGQTMAFASLILFELIFAFSCRSQKYPLYKIGFFTNKWLILAILWESSLMLLLIYAPFLSPLFHLVPLGLHDWAIVIPIAASGYICNEVGKIVRNKIRGVKFPEKVPTFAPPTAETKS